MIAQTNDGGDEADVSADALSYSFKPSAIGAPWEFRLGEQGLDWRKGRLKGTVAYRDIRRVRLSFRPATFQTQRFLAEIWPMHGPKLEIASSSWKSMVEQERLDRAYRTFVAALHRRLIASGADPSFENGSPPALYWPGVAVFVGTALGMAALAVRALQTGTASAALFIGAFLALFLWQVGVFFKRNRPGRYRPEELPPDVMPSAS